MVQYTKVRIAGAVGGGGELSSSCPDPQYSFFAMCSLCGVW